MPTPRRLELELISQKRSSLETVCNVRAKCLPVQGLGQMHRAARKITE